MQNQDSGEYICEQLEGIFNRPLTDEEKFEITLWQKGKALQSLLNFEYGWQVAIDTLKQYPQQLYEDLMETAPGDKDLIAAKHAAAYGSNETYRRFVQDIQAAISTPMPEIVKQGFLKAKTEIPLDAM